MRPGLTVLQLDTRFPRIPGDVACPETYLEPVEVIRIPAASVGRIVTEAPAAIDIAPFEDALRAARGDVIATSCGFLAHWQDHLQALTQRPVVASALVALDRLEASAPPVSVLTFDAAKLWAGHWTAARAPGTQLIGLRPEMHLRQVIERDIADLDAGRAAEEIADMLRARLAPDCESLLLECTNLPPYKTAIRAVFHGAIHDILTEIEARRPGTVLPEFL